MAPTTNLLRIKEVADLLGVTTRTVYRRIWAGELPATKLGGLYYVKSADLDALLGQVSLFQKPPTLPSLLKCGACLRVLPSPDRVSANCSLAGCVEVICRDCSSKGIHRCRQHVITNEDKWKDALAAQQAGQVSLLLRGYQARLRELNYLNRVRGRLAQVETLVHPQSGELITIKDWESFAQVGDDRAEILRLKGSVLLDAKDTSEFPLNAWLSYLLPSDTKRKNSPLEIKVQVLSRLERMLNDGFDTSPLNEADLSRFLVQVDQDLQSDATFRVLALASPTGWDQTARDVVAPAQASTAFSHPRLLIYLYDLEADALIYHENDARLKQYAELFNPLLVSEEAVVARLGIEALLIERGHGSLTVSDATRALRYSEPVVRAAFELMAESGLYRLVTLEDIGTAIQRI